MRQERGAGYEALPHRMLELGIQGATVGTERAQQAENPQGEANWCPLLVMMVPSSSQALPHRPTCSPGPALLCIPKGSQQTAPQLRGVTLPTLHPPSPRELPRGSPHLETYKKGDVVVQPSQADTLQNHHTSSLTPVAPRALAPPGHSAGRWGALTPGQLAARRASGPAGDQGEAASSFRAWSGHCISSLLR